MRSRLPITRTRTPCAAQAAASLPKKILEQAQERHDFPRRAFPIICREGIQRERADAQARSSAHCTLPHGFRTPARWPSERARAARGRPPARALQQDRAVQCWGGTDV